MLTSTQVKRYSMITVLVIAVLIIAGTLINRFYDVDLEVVREPKLNEEMCLRRTDLEFPGQIDILQIKRLGQRGALVKYYCYPFNLQLYEIKISDLKKYYTPVECNCTGLR